MGNKDKSAYSLVRKLDDQQLNDKSISSASIAGSEALEGENGMFLIACLRNFISDRWYPLLLC